MLPLSPVRRVLVFAFVLGILGAAYADGSDAGAPRAIVHDPPPLTDKVQWVFDLRWDKGDVYLVAVRKVELATPMTTPRAVGRFALELSEKGLARRADSVRLSGPRRTRRRRRHSHDRETTHANRSIFPSDDTG